MSKAETTAGVRAKLAAHKENSKGERTITLNGSGVAVTIPNFIGHESWMRALRQADGDGVAAQAAFVAEVARFEGEKLTLTDLRELLDVDDGRQLVAAVFNRRPATGGDAGGNGKRAG